jgi:hypothetical protein
VLADKGLSASNNNLEIECCGLPENLKERTVGRVKNDGTVRARVGDRTIIEVAKAQHTPQEEEYGEFEIKHQRGAIIGAVVKKQEGDKGSVVKINGGKGTKNFNPTVEEVEDQQSKGRWVGDKIWESRERRGTPRVAEEGRTEVIEGERVGERNKQEERKKEQQRAGEPSTHLARDGADSIFHASCLSLADLTRRHHPTLTIGINTDKGNSTLECMRTPFSSSISVRNGRLSGTLSEEDYDKSLQQEYCRHFTVDPGGRVVEEKGCRVKSCTSCTWRRDRESGLISEGDKAKFLWEFMTMVEMDTKMTEVHKTSADQQTAANVEEDVFGNSGASGYPTTRRPFHYRREIDQVTDIEEIQNWFIESKIEIGPKATGREREEAQRLLYT